MPVDVDGPEDFLSRIEAALASPGVKTVFAVNPEKIMRARKDPDLKHALEGSDFLLPDGIGTVLGIRLFYGERVPRTTGIGLMESLLALAEARGFGVFLFGARPESNRIAAEAILERYPKLRLSGRRDGYVPPEEYPRLIEEINGSGADLLFVALGSPFPGKMDRQVPEGPRRQGLHGSRGIARRHVRRRPRGPEILAGPRARMALPADPRALAGQAANGPAGVRFRFPPGTVPVRGEKMSLAKIMVVAGARPNFIKVAPILEALRRDGRFRAILVHTGQHYGHDMSDSFFRELGLPEPDLNLGVGSASHAVQTARIMIAFEKACPGANGRTLSSSSGTSIRRWPRP